MKLGLWFNPCAAAVSSQMLQNHRDCVQEWQGQQSPPQEIWETEASHNLCLASRCAEAFADELIRLVREVGVTYFKWDAVSHYLAILPTIFTAMTAFLQMSAPIVRRLSRAAP